MKEDTNGFRVGEIVFLVLEPPGQVYAWISPDLPTGPDDVFYVGTHDDPHESRSLAPGDSLPCFGTGGKRQKGRVGQGKKLDNRKGSRGQRKTDALLNHQKQYPEQHPRKYLLDKVHKITRTEAPNDRTRRLLDCETDEDGVLRTFAPASVPYTPEETAANILRHFHLTASTTGSPAHDQTVTNEETIVLPTAGTENNDGED